MYIANKVCRFNGHDFLKGEVVPEELILESKKAQLLKTGVLAETKEEGKGLFTIPINSGDEQIVLELTNEELIQVFSYLGKSADDAKKVIDGITSNEVLILIDSTETRKGMKEYIADHAKQLLNE